MARKGVIDVAALLALNPDFEKAVWSGEQWAVDHMNSVESINRNEPAGFRRPFDGQPQKWCGSACPFDEGCITCTLPENPEMARTNRAERNRKERAKSAAVLISGEVNTAMVVRVEKMITHALERGVTVLDAVIESHGGQVPAGLEIFDLIRNAPVTKRVATVPRYALSMAAIILQAFDERVASPEAEILMHHTRFRELTIETLRNKAAIDFIVRMSEPDELRMDEIIRERTGRSAAEIKQLNDRDKKMTSREALDFGLIDAIRE